jgi:predicted RNA-binding protein with PUA-like domain
MAIADLITALLFSQPRYAEVQVLQILPGESNMTYWLLKSEPQEYAYADLEREKKTVWNGVKNPLALKHMRTMQPFDLGLFYHTGKERRIVGIVEVISSPYPDPALSDPKRVVIDIQAKGLLAKPVTLAQIKQDTQFTDFDLLRIPRLSVVPVAESYWHRILQLTTE